VQAFEYFSPASVREAVEALKSHPKGRVLAGGTDMLVRMKDRVWRPDAVVDIKRIKGSNELSFDAKTGLKIGSAVTMRQLELAPLVRESYAGLAQGAEVVGSFQIRNLATVVGNVCNAAPSADTAPGLIAFGAKVRIAGPRGRRTLSVERFMTGPGQNALEPGEFVTAIQVPVLPPRTGSAYVRHTIREAMDIAVVGVGAAITLKPRTGACEEIRIVLGAVAPTPLRSAEAESILRGQILTPELIKRAGEAAAEEARPISDVRASAGFRRELVRVLTHRMVAAAHEDALQKSASRRRAA